MQRIFILSVVAVLLSACNGSSGNTVSLPASEPIPNVSSPISTEAAPSAIAATIIPTLSSSPTPVPPSLMLADFPLSAGASWKYSAEISYQDPKDNSKRATWSGFITYTVVDRKAAPDGGIVFTLQEDLEPTPPEGVWRKPGTLKYTVSGDGISDGRIKIYQWPLSDHLSWKAFSDSGYDMYSKNVGTVNTPYGEMKGCYTLELRTNPDSTMDTFCPGTGFVEHYYKHFGTPQEEQFVLVSYKRGQ